MNFWDIPQHKQLDRLRRIERCIEQSRFSSRFSMQGFYPTFQKQSWHPCQLPTHCISSVSPARSTAITQSIRYKKWPCNHINIRTHITPSCFFTSWKLKEDVSNLLPNQLHRSCKTHTKLLPRAKIKMTPLCPEQSHATTPACVCNETSCIWTFVKNRFLLKNNAFQPSRAIL